MGARIRVDSRGARGSSRRPAPRTACGSSKSESFDRELQMQRIEGRWERQGRRGGDESRGVGDPRPGVGPGEYGSRNLSRRYIEFWYREVLRGCKKACRYCRGITPGHGSPRPGSISGSVSALFDRGGIPGPGHWRADGLVAAAVGEASAHVAAVARADGVRESGADGEDVDARCERRRVRAAVGTARVRLGSTARRYRGRHRLLGAVLSSPDDDLADFVVLKEPSILDGPRDTHEF